jgi:hypothetical protein
MIEKVVLFFLISFFISIVFLGCHVITSYVADPKQAFYNMPPIMHRNPWMGNLAGILSFIVFFSLFINGWYIGEFGIVPLLAFWFVSNSKISSYFKFEKGRNDYAWFRNPFYQLLFGGIILAILTLINIEFA